MDQSLSKQTNIRSVSFAPDKKVLPQEQLIIKLITYSIDNNAPITKADIINAYAEYVLMRDRKLIKKIFVRFTEHYHSVYTTIEVNKEEFAKLYRTKIAARTWFKSNLAGAIIKGRLLVIPIIDIE